MAFLYSFMNLFQPGIVFPSLAAAKPMMVISALALMTGISSDASYKRSLAYKHPAFVYLVLFLGVQVISVYRSGLREMLDMFLTWYQFLIYMVLAILLITTAEHLRKFVWGMLLAGQFIVFYGIYVAVNNLGTTVGGAAAGAYGMYENHNDYSYVIILILPFLYMFWKNSEPGLKKMILLFFLGSSIAGMLFSLSRGGALALVFEIFLIQLYFYKQNRKKLPLIMMALLGLMVLSYQWAKRAEHSTESYTAEQAESSRIELWKAGKNMFKAHPFLGVGSRKFGEYAKEYYDLSYDQLGKNAHNTYIQILATTGLIGFFAFMGFAWKLIKDLRIDRDTVKDKTLECIRSATLISFYSLLFRAITNAKPHEWGFYMLCVIGVICMILIRTKQEEEAAQAKPVSVT
ncbi:MAG: O-antigen ligase family protein [Gammaproteobacteria bacterium]|nr:O-antigen ligase family protein [Gammaproteobacteria bacterium]